MKNKYEEILNIKIYSLGYNELKKDIINDIKENTKSFIVAINPEKIMAAKKNKKLFEILNKAKYKIPDGIGMIFASKIKRKRIKQRITGIDTMEMLCKLAAEKKYKVFLYGSKEDIVKQTKKIIENKYPSINIVGYLNGYEKDEDNIIKTINKAHPNILFVALGSPKQEKFINNNMERINCNIFQGVGGSFDVISGNLKRAPKWMRNNGLEWLYRLIKEPKRIFRQIKIIKFLFIIIFCEKRGKK